MMASSTLSMMKNTEKLNVSTKSMKRKSAVKLLGRVPSAMSSSVSTEVDTVENSCIVVRNWR